MERNIHQWNEQVLARRRGLSGRFMSLSKRWTTFGSSRSSSSSSSPTSSSSNYDPRGFYRPDAPEALMRRLADHCLLLRDTKLALSTYEILTTDFQNDKAWTHYAAAAEMAAVSALLAPPLVTAKLRPDKLDDWIKAAAYNYTDRSRSTSPFYPLRALALSVELLRLRGTAAADDAARWAARILEMNLVGDVGAALFTERIAACYAVRPGAGTLRVGSRRRKAAFWNVLAAQAWWGQSKALQAEKCLDAAMYLYGTHREDGPDAHSQGHTHNHNQKLNPAGRLPFSEMQRFVDELRQQILGLRLTNRGLGGGSQHEDAELEGYDEADPLGAHADALVEEVSETLDASPRAHRRSLVGGALPPNIDAGPLSPALERSPEKDDLFEGAAV